MPNHSKDNIPRMANPSTPANKASFAAGCFWDVEAAFRQVDGVLETVAGYTGGPVPHPTWDW